MKETLRSGKPGNLFYIKKKLPKDHESEWDRIQRRRKECKCLGGKHREWHREWDPAFIISKENYLRIKAENN